MTQRIHHHLLLGSTLALFLSGCLLKIDGLDAGLDDDDDAAEMPTTGDDDPSALECLIGTEVDSLGVAQSSWSPGCEVTCDDGWGHDGSQLPIEWTSSVPIHEGAPVMQPSKIGLLESGRVVVASLSEHAVGLLFFEPDGVNIGGYTADDLGSRIYSLAIDSHVLYIAHGDEDGTVELRAVDIDSQQPLWSQTFTGELPGAIARAGGKLAFTLRPQEESAETDLIVLDLDGNMQWTLPTLDYASDVAMSPSGDRIAVAGEVTRIYAAEDGALLDELVNGSSFPVYMQSVTFVDEDRVVTIGAGLEYERFDGWLSGDSLTGGSSWERSYNRATSWCPDPLEDDEWTAATAELLAEVDTLADGTLVVVGSENFEGGGVYGSHPWVARFSADGEFLASDRGLWDGYAIDTVAGPDGSLFALIVDGPVTFSEGPPAVESRSFAVRKYVP